MNSRFIEIDNRIINVNQITDICKNKHNGSVTISLAVAVSDPSGDGVTGEWIDLYGELAAEVWHYISTTWVSATFKSKVDKQNL